MSISVIFIAVTVVISLMAMNDNSLKMKLIHNPYAVVHRKEIYRVLTSGFIHADYMHLLLNMYAFYIFGEAVESYFNYYFDSSGRIYFILLYIIGILVANIPDIFKHKDNVYYNSLGASGGVSSIVFASIILSPLSKLFMFPIPIPMPAYIFAVIYIGYSIYMDRKQADNINHMAHLWGGLWGVAFLVTILPGILQSFFEQIKNSF